MTPNDEELPRADWRQALDTLTKEHEGDEVTIEVLTDEFGDQHEAEKVPFAYVEYDPHGDMARVAVGGRDGRYPVELSHAIEHPGSITVHTPAPGETAVTLDVVAADGTQTLVTFHPRPALPA